MLFNTSIHHTWVYRDPEGRLQSITRRTPIAMCTRRYLSIGAHGATSPARSSIKKTLYFMFAALKSWIGCMHSRRAEAVHVGGALLNEVHYLSNSYRLW